MLKLYTIFHLNLFFSSIREKDFPVVIRRCFWPILNCIEEFGIPLGIEASAVTLETINKLDPRWVAKLKELMALGKCEFVGSGFTQLIGPLVPQDVNQRNITIGNELYRKFLGAVPSIVFVNEQAYSRSMLKHYRAGGYSAIVTEWNNPAQLHPEWKKEWKYHPQIVIGNGGQKMPVVWNNSIAFQKFQRYVNGAIELDEYMDYFRSHQSKTTRFFLIYGNDAEIFDFRPGRFATETKIIHGEWNRILVLFQTLLKERDMELVLPSAVLREEKDTKNAFQTIYLESPQDPIPVKKQEKYNITRWGLTGNSVAINTACFKIYENIKNTNNPALWKELCYLWSSDFRTHIEKNRFSVFEKRLAKALKVSSQQTKQTKFGSTTDPNLVWVKKPKITQTRRHLDIETKEIKLVLNLHKGLTIDSLIFKKISPLPLVGTILHDYYDDIRFAVDWFSGHSVIGVPGKSQMTDLGGVKPKVVIEEGKVVVSARIYLGSASRNQKGGGWVKKTIILNPVGNTVKLDYRFDFLSSDSISWRTGFVTLCPEAFDRKTLFYACHNGGQKKEKFLLHGVNAIDKNPVSFLVSAQSALGNTEGQFEIGDKEKKVVIETDMSKCAALPSVHFQRFPRTFFLRSLFSLCEIDDTTSVHGVSKGKYKANFTMTISAQKTT